MFMAYIARRLRRAVRTAARNYSAEPRQRTKAPSRLASQVQFHCRGKAVSADPLGSSAATFVPARMAASLAP